MSELQITARLRIHEGKLDQFRIAAEACLKSTQNKDKGTSQYDWFFSEDQSECVVRERYADSDAVLEHIGNLGETMGALMEVSDLSLEVFGAPSEKLANATKGMDIKVYGFYQGL